MLPEYHLTGWHPDVPGFRSAAAQAQNYLEQYCSLARELAISIVPGTLVMLSSEGTLLNKTFFISSSGNVLGQYTKVNLWHPERDHLTSGPQHAQSCASEGVQSHHNVIHTPIGIVGLLICYDLAFPEAFRALTRAGAEIIIIPTFTKSDDMSMEARAYNPSGEELLVRTALVTRAFENTCCVIFCNVGGPKSDGYMGLSQAVLPIVGTVSGSFTDATEDIRIVEVDLNVLDVAERNYKIRKDLAEPDYHYT